MVDTFTPDFPTCIAQLVINMQKGMKQMSIELKIKAKNLAHESRLIREGEVEQRDRARQLRGKQKNTRLEDERRESLYLHRIQVVRPEARSTHLARMFLKGTPYKHVERSCRIAPDRDKVVRMVVRYGKADKDTARAAVDAWLDA